MKKRISIILTTIILIINICVPVSANQIIENHYFNNEPLNKLWGLFQDVGFIVSYPAWSYGKTFGGALKSYLESKNSAEADNINSDQDAINWCNEGIIVNSVDNSLTLNNNLKDFVNYSIQDYVNNSKLLYTYSFNIDLYPDQFSSNTQFTALKTMCRDFQDFYYIVYWDQLNRFAIIDQDKYSLIGVVDGNLYVGNVYSFDTWDINGSYITYHWDGVNSYVKDTNQSQLLQVHTTTSANNVALNKNRAGIISSGRNIVVPVFTTLDALKNYSVGNAPYYFNNSTYSNFSQSSGDYNINSGNRNTTSYGDVINYVNSFNTENGKDPTPSEIQIFIENPTPNPTPTPNPDNPNGGSGGSSSSATANNEGINITINNNHSLNFGSGLSGNTVSGNGSGSVSNIFDWLSNLGNIIGQFVKNVGEMIVNALEGIAEAITTILEGIPNILTPLIEFVFGGLPEELQALITLGITCVIFVGVIKAIKR